MRTRMFKWGCLVFVLFGIFVISGCGGSSSSPPPPADNLGITANADDDSVSIFSTKNLTKIGEDLPLSGEFPWEITLSDDGSIAYVMCRYSNSIETIDLAAGVTTTNGISLTGVEPSKAVIAGDGYLYVAYMKDSFVSKVDIMADPPVEVDQIALRGSGYYSIAYVASAVTPTGGSLYLGANGNVSSATLSKVDLVTGVETDFWNLGDGVPEYLYDINIDDAGLAYFSAYNSEGVIKRWDTTTDTWAEPVPSGQEYEWMVDAILTDDVLVGTYNGDNNNGGVVLIDTTLGIDGYDYSQDDDDYYAVSLPFTFTFLGEDYTEVYIGSNGVVAFDSGDGSDYELDPFDILGFSPNNEDLDSSGYIFNYSSRTYDDHAVFQWSTATHDDSEDPNTVSIFEVVLFDDGSARFDYGFSMPDAINGDDGYSYGVADGSAPLVDMRADYGSPFDFERQSFAWDPATPTTMTAVPFEFEGTGVLHLPVTGQPHGIAATDKYAFIPLSRDYDTGKTSTTVQVYDVETLLPAGTITVGEGPRAIAIQP